ncbi:hypothetical protein TSOC_010543 [Tetrabaena socialis]|uniref:Uncharacterized protein n=1 Tax=Tetrabaena socialis TaxID=47790 RepID=A0A2J7ZT08_9CHLO|nr:hypothetical protein TSOC_010543 [Tetrabaena socialis]|eukprot:PNH03406.1 hypothetical protein TSOC_010543 [Tetrabaena socialis]
MDWVLDVTTEHAALTTTGGRVWDAARRLCSYLEETGEALGLLRPGVSVLELGSGLGWLGMSLARNLPDVGLVVMTEQEEGGGVDWLRHNLRLNTRLASSGKLQVVPCDWLHYGQLGAQAGELGDNPLGAPGAGELQEEPASRVPQPAPCQGAGSTDRAAVSPAHSPGAAGAAGECSGGSGQPECSASWLAQQQWDFIIGSDLVYNTVGAVCLPRVMRALARPNTRILYCHTKHRFDTYDIQFFEELAACGLACSEVHEPSKATPPPSPPPLTDLFPEMRIAVYSIQPSSHC